MKHRGNNTFFQMVLSIIKLFFVMPFLLTKKLLDFIGRQYNRFLEKLRFSITLKMTTVYVMNTFLILLLINAAVLGGFILYSLSSIEQSLDRDFSLASSYINSSGEIPQRSLDELALIENIQITIYDDARQIVYSTIKDKTSIILYRNNDTVRNMEMQQSFMLVSDSGKSYSSISGVFDALGMTKGSSMVLDKKLIVGSQSYNIQIIDALLREHLYLGDLILILLGADIFFILITSLSGARASRKNLRPIDIMNRTVKSITVNALDTRLDIKGSQNELKDLAKTFNSMLDRIQHSYEMQNQFVSDASHELRTPISVIQGYASLLDRWGKNDREVLEESIEAIKTEAESMKSLIEKLLFLARGDKGVQKVEKEEFNINDFIEEIVKETKLIDNSHEITSEKSEASVVYADRKLLKEAVRVFVDNSIKYTPEGGKIDISCFSQSNSVILRITDTGSGIPKEDISKIFDRFYRADKSRTKETGGTGLGLAIAKWIVMKHKGTIEVESQLNVGTKISVILPLKV